MADLNIIEHEEDGAHHIWISFVELKPYYTIGPNVVDSCFTRNGFSQAFTIRPTAVTQSCSWICIFTHNKDMICREFNI